MYDSDDLPEIESNELAISNIGVIGEPDSDTGINTS